ncbi:hypothetical protein E4665_07760 [Sporolactobacillus shoreae]|uniref:LXG domain-containing protein n=1 Tax=Sporolactobacillus shoreae TaxID=1465501 RepID=A0A4Z0GRJ1_9BACL|nr:hypothetical protein [Sporolactobacillus shoreae]TGA98738.1 hypothetical protein E4665_07760 [Sporolactobacillus shoreae]
MMGRDVSYKQSSWEDMGQAISHVSTWGGTLDQMRRADQAFQQIRDAVDSLDEDHRISFSYRSMSGALDKLSSDYQKLYTFTGEAGDAVNRHIDHPFYTEIDAFVSAMAQLSISQFHTKNTLNVTEMQATSTMANVATYEKVTKKDITLDDLFNTSSLMKASLRSEYENFKALSTSDQAEKVTFDQYKEAIQYNYCFDYKSIKDKQIDKEFWVNLGIGAAIVVLTIACPPAGAVAGVAYGAIQMSDAVTGKSWISGRELSTGERVSSAAFGALDAIPGAEAAGAFGTIGRTSMRSAEKVADLTKTLGQASKGRLVQLRQISRAGVTSIKQAGADLGDRLSLKGLQPEFAGAPRVSRGEGFIQNVKNPFRQMASKEGVSHPSSYSKIEKIQNESNGFDKIDGINIVDGKVGGKIPIEDFYKIRKASIHNEDGDTMTLGKYTPSIENGVENWGKPGPDSYIVKAGGDSTYFDLGSKWNEIQNKYHLTNDEMFTYFNVPALEASIKSGKIIKFTHDPRLYPDSYLSQEWQHLKDAHGFRKLKKEGDVWIAN